MTFGEVHNDYRMMIAISRDRFLIFGKSKEIMPGEAILYTDKFLLDFNFKPHSDDLFKYIVMGT